MEPLMKNEINGTPLPQRNIKQQANMENTQEMDVVPEKKPRFGNPGGGNMGQRDNFGGSFNRDSNRGGRGRFNRGQRGGNRNPNIKQEGNDQSQERGGDRRGGDNRDRGDRSGGFGAGRKGDDFLVGQRLKNVAGPTHELPPIDSEETKFSGRNRLYIGNLTNDINEAEIKEMFKPFGEISEAFINAEKNFAFLKVDYHANAERAKRELDGSMRKNRSLRVRFAPNATIVRVKNLTPFVSNELLFKAFEIFGPVERAVIIVDDRGKPTGEGIVEFARKSGAMTAIRYCSEKCFFLTSSLRPCVVEIFEINDDTDGYPDKSMNKKTQEFFKARQIGPRFAEVGSFEHEYGTRWKQLHELFKQKHEALKRELQMEEEKLEAQMEYARYEHETEMLREQLRMREQDRDRQKLEWELKQRESEELRNREEEQMRRQQDEMQLRMNRQDEELRRRQQENTLFMQAQQLNSLLDQQEISQSGDQNNRNGTNVNRAFDFGGSNNIRNNFLSKESPPLGNNTLGGGNNQDQGFLSFDIGQNKQNRFDEQNQGGSPGGQLNQRVGNNNRPWDRRGEDFQNKRRRF